MARKKSEKEKEGENINSPFLPSKEMAELQEDLEFYSANVKREEVRMNCASILALLGEFLDDFVVIGHDPKGWDFVMRKADTPKDIRALQSLLEDFADGNIKMSPGMKRLPSSSEIDDFMRQMNEDDFMEDDDDDDDE